MAYIRTCRTPARMGRPGLVPGGLACAAAVRRFSATFTPLRTLNTRPLFRVTLASGICDAATSSPSL